MDSEMGYAAPASPPNNASWQVRIEATHDKLYISCKITRTMEITDCLEEPTDMIPNNTEHVITSALLLRFFIARWFVLFSKIINQNY